MGYRDAAVSETETDPREDEAPSELEVAHLRSLMEARAIGASACCGGAVLVLSVFWLALGPVCLPVRVASLLALAPVCIVLEHAMLRGIAFAARRPLRPMWGELVFRSDRWVFVADDGRTYAASAFGAYGMAGRRRARVQRYLREALFFPLPEPPLPPLPTVPMGEAELEAFRACFHG